MLRAISEIAVAICVSSVSWKPTAFASFRPASRPAPLPPGTPPCQANGLAAKVIGSNGATGHVITSFGFTGAAAVCYLDGTPSVGILDSKGNSIGFRQQAPYFPPLRPGRALIEPGPAPARGVELKVGQASLNIDWISQPEFCPGVQAAQPATAVISIPGGGIVEIPIPLEPSAYPCAGLGVAISKGRMCTSSQVRRPRCRPSRCRSRPAAILARRSPTW